jgi:hypothetical protein
MPTKLESLRLFFPAEVTAAYLGIQKLLTANGVKPTEFMWSMVIVAVLLAIINSALYWHQHKTTSILWQVVLAVGFFIWVGNIDLPRFKDLPLLGTYIEITAPAAVIFYTLLTSFFELPKDGTNAPT